MNPTHHLAKLSKVFHVRLRRLRALSVWASAGSLPADRTVAFVTIELLAAWANFTRAYYLSCWEGARTTEGNRVDLTLPPGSPTDGIGFAVKRRYPNATPKQNGEWRRRDEPTWHRPETLMKLAKDLSFTNSAEISAAFSGGTRVFLDLPVYRNFFAHRGHGTFRAAMDNAAIQHGIVGAHSPAESLLSMLPGRPQSLLGEWFDDISLTVAYLC